MAKKRLESQKLRMFLSTLFVLILIGGGGAFYLGISKLQSFSTEVNHHLVDADASSQKLNQLSLMKNQLKNSADLIAKATNVTISPSNYQSRVSADIKAYAQLVGVSVTSINFDQPQPGAPSSNIFDVIFGENINYTQLVQFLSLTENNLPKITTATLNIKRVDNSPNDIQIISLKFEVAVK